jgi:hypothetical protein
MTPPEGSPADISLRRLEREICELAAHLAAATCRWLLLVEQWDRLGGWAEWGVTSCAHWLSWRCSIGLVAAREHVRVARRLAELPLIREAFSTGELSYCKVRAVTRVATPETEETLVELARHATGAQVEKLVRGFGGALSASVDGAQRAHERRHLIWSTDVDGSLLIHGRLPPAEGALVLAALRAGEEPYVGPREAGDDSAESPGAASAGERRADALVAIARCALESDGAARAGGDPCEVVVHVDAETLAADEVKGRAELEDGPALAPETVRRLGCDAAVVGIVERDGRPLSVGRRTRTIPPALRRALRARDSGCRFPGCTHRRFLHAHHIHHWGHGGGTSLENLVQLCSHHHRLVHEGGYCVERAGADGVRFRRPNGNVIPSTWPAAVANGPPVERANAACGISVDDKTCMPRSAGDLLDYGIAVEGLCRLAAGSPTLNEREADP